ncbi:protein Abitram [Diorhabda carinulata]|uniref:protein Abitram n=1 Tax=Diorhabda carinulata TaxID=1163345 RepID=UPI0025A00ADA|nr:protein Abitram [Diorhabda carinulata]
MEVKHCFKLEEENVPTKFEDNNFQLHTDIDIFDDNIKCEDDTDTKPTQLIMDNENNIDTNTLIQNKIEQLNIPILESITQESINNFKFFNEKQYENRYFLHSNNLGQNEDICIRVHTNKLMLITLSRRNDIVTSNKRITEINFEINKKIRCNVKVVGKKKNGAKLLRPDTIMCRVRLEGEKQLRNIRCGVTAYLVEINGAVIKDPNLLIKDPKSYGYLAIMMPKVHQGENDSWNTHLISEEEYSNLISK